MIDFSIEEQASRIHNTKTKEYFEEVRVSYSVGNYRSCIVMLYSVVICDLVYKLQDLRDIYKDEKAGDILDNIANSQKSNPTSPKWETELIDEIAKSTNLLEPQDKTNIDYLQKHRHLSAHPALTEGNLLFQPSKENARSHIRNMLEGLLTKPSIPSKRILDIILSAIAEHKEELLSPALMKQFLSARFLSNVREVTLIQIFKGFWKLAFIVQDDDCVKNRHINVTALTAIYTINQPIFQNVIKAESNYYSQVKLSDNIIIQYLFDFLCRYSEVYNLLSADTKLLLREKADNDAQLLLKSWFLRKDDPKTYINGVIENIKTKYTQGYKPEIQESAYDNFTEYLYENGYNDHYWNIVSYLYNHSGTYNSADWRYFLLIAKGIKNLRFSKEQLIEILKISNRNSQIYDRRAAEASIKEIYNALKELGGEIQIDDYPNIRKYLVEKTA